VDHGFKAKNWQNNKSKVVICRHDHHIARVACAFGADGALCVFGGDAHLGAYEIQPDGIGYASIGFRSGTDRDVKVLVCALLKRFVVGKPKKYTAGFIFDGRQAGCGNFGFAVIAGAGGITCAIPKIIRTGRCITNSETGGIFKNQPCVE